MLERWRSQTNLINFAFAILLFLSPWILGFAYGKAGLNAWASAVVLALFSMVAVVSFAEWEEWIDLAVGAWILVSPWVLGFEAGSSATKIHVMIGVIVTALSALELFKEHWPPRTTASPEV